MRIHKGEGTRLLGNGKDGAYNCRNLDHSDNWHFAFGVQMNLNSSPLEQILCRVVEKALFHLQH